MNDRPSKKLMVVLFSIQAVVGMADGVENKLPYAIVICIMFGVYKLGQGLIDWKNNGKKEE